MPSAVASAPPVAAKAAFENHGGMWMPSQIPLKAEELKRLGLAIDPALLADPKSSLLGSIVNLNGCSASFVSKQGLVVTNHHCAVAALQKNSTPTENLLKTGTLAKTHADERSSGPLGFEGADVGPFQDRPQRPLGCDRMLADELPVTRGHAAEIL